MKLLSSVKSVTGKIVSTLESVNRARAAAELARAGYHRQANELIAKTHYTLP